MNRKQLYVYVDVSCVNAKSLYFRMRDAVRITK